MIIPIPMFRAECDGCERLSPMHVGREEAYQQALALGWRKAQTSERIYCPDCALAVLGKEGGRNATETR